MAQPRWQGKRLSCIRLRAQVLPPGKALPFADQRLDLRLQVDMRFKVEISQVEIACILFSFYNYF